MSTSAEFQRSRMYAQGWNAANELTAEQTALLDSRSAAALNPYTEKMDRARWSKGFEEALSASGARHVGKDSG